jgi:hypothetical protein
MNTRTIDALLNDGRSALSDLEGASPGGGQVTSEPAYGPQITPGDVVRYCGSWMAVTEASHNGILGLTRLAMIDAAGAVTPYTMLASDVIDRRTDARIDPDTLYKLADQSAAYRYVSTAPGATDGAVDDQQLAAWIEGRTYREALSELLAIAQALIGRLDTLVASAAHLWAPPATGDGPRRGDPADRTADAKRVLFDRLLAAIPPGQGDQAEEWLTDLLYLAEDSLSRTGQEEVIRETLGEAGPPPGAERDYEVAGETLTVRARSPEEAVALALREVAEEARDRYYEPDPNPRCYVRLVHSRGQWQLVYAYEAPALPPAGDEDGPLADKPGR